MNPFDHITTVLAGRSCWPTRHLVVSEPRQMGKTERMRAYLREVGSANAATLADEADVPQTALVSALLKADLIKGSVFRRGHTYHWNPLFDAQHHQRIADAVRLLRANGYQVKKVQR
ncbi:MAG: hypothetical protein K0M67_16360 [Thiobacillus sp.]|nr:hypothetical protein [Thiobacillus sp.]